MLNAGVGSAWLIGSWIAALAIIMIAGTATGANPSTTALFVALGVAPGIVFAFLAGRAASPCVAQIVHPAEKKDGRS
jgi:inner membrane protein involved in colicin E2 resistance